eukprot:tig00020539_g10406.t1
MGESLESDKDGAAIKEEREGPGDGAAPQDDAGGANGTGDAAKPPKTPAATKTKALHLRHPKQPVVYLITNDQNICYVGSTSDMARRLREHNYGSKFAYTRGKGPWKALAIAYGFAGVAESRAFEREVKGGGGGARRKLAVMKRLAKAFTTIEVDTDETADDA